MRTLNRDTLQRMEEYIREYQMSEGCSPTYRDIQSALDMSSLKLVQTYILALEREGKISRGANGKLKMPVELIGSNMVSIPLVGSIACGLPNFAEEYIENTYTLPSSLFGSGKLYMLRAFGDSMVEAGIEEGDLLVIRQQQVANDGEVVVALVEGETTLKRLYHKGEKILLHPENKEMSDIIVSDCDIQGVLVGCIKKF